MIIFIDTTATKMSPTLEGGDWESLARYVRENNTRVIITDLVFDETTNHVREDLKKQENALQQIHVALKRAGIEVPLLPSHLDVESMLEGFRSKLEGAIKTHGFERMSLDGIDVAPLVTRALERRPPFDSGGKEGFRDAVQWELIKRTANAATAKVVIVTSDNDFKKDGQLHPELRTEITSNQPATVCTTLKDFLAQFVYPTLDEKEEREIQAQKQRRYGTFDIHAFLERIRDEFTATVGEAFARKYYVSPMFAIPFPKPVLKSIDWPLGLVDVAGHKLLDDRVSLELELCVRGTTGFETSGLQLWQCGGAAPEYDVIFNAYIIIVLEKDETVSSYRIDTRHLPIDYTLRPVSSS